MSALVVDANILMRAVLGKRTRGLLAKYGTHVDFAAPAVVFDEARRNLLRVIAKRQGPVEPAISYLDSLTQVLQVVDLESYSSFEAIARERMARRDEDDWPVLATALALKCPIWTEDRDFFGCGVATWTTDRVELYLGDATITHGA